MNRFTHTKSLLMAGSTLALVFALTGCGGGGGGGSKSSTPASSKAASSIAPSSTSASSSSTNGLANLIQADGGLFGYNANTGVIRRSALIGNSIETYDNYDGSAFVPVTASGADYAYVLTAGGWVRGQYKHEVASFNLDGTVTTTNTTPWDIGNTLYIEEEIDLAGRNILAFLDLYPNTEDMLATVNPAATFSAGAKAYLVEHKNNDPIYSIYIDEGRDDGKCWWEGGDPVSDSGGNCMAVNMTADNNMLEKAVSGYEKLFSSDVAINTSGYRAVILGQVGPNNLEMQLLNDAQKTVKFYENLPNGNFTKLVTTGTWSEITLPYLAEDNKAAHVVLPEAVRVHLQTQGTKEVTFAQHNGHLRPIGFADPKDDNNISFNAAANTNITTATTNYTNPLVGTWTLGTSDIFIFSDNNTFTHVKAESDDPDNCYVGSATGTYSWNPNSSELEINLLTDSTASEEAGSCSIGGKSKMRVDGANTIVLEIEDQEFPFTKAPAASGFVVQRLK